MLFRSLDRYVDWMGPWFGGPDVLAMYGEDHSVPRPGYAALVESFNRSQAAYEVRIETLEEYMEKLPPSTRSSLLIDLEQGKRIEVEALQGAAVRRAATHGVPVPILSTLYALLKAWEGGPVK